MHELACALGIRDSDVDSLMCSLAESLGVPW